MATGFEWRTAKGTMLSIRSIPTSHLYNIMAMVWNNTCEPHQRVGKYRLYNFNSFYTEEYMAQALEQTMEELQSRGDLTTSMQNGLNLIRVEKVSVAWH